MTRSPEELADLEARLRAAVLEMIAEGVKICDQSFGVKYRRTSPFVPGPCMCPIGCLTVVESRKHPIESMCAALWPDGTTGELIALYLGFDRLTGSRGRSPLAEIGQRLREEFLP